MLKYIFHFILYAYQSPSCGCRIALGYSKLPRIILFNRWKLASKQTFSYTPNYAISILKYSFTKAKRMYYNRMKKYITSNSITKLSLPFLKYLFSKPFKLYYRLKKSLIKNKIRQLYMMCRKIFHYVSKRKLHVMKSWASWTFLEIDVKKLKTISKKSVAQIFKSNCSCHFDLCTKYF